MAAFDEWLAWVEEFAALGARCPEIPRAMVTGGKVPCSPPPGGEKGPRVLLCSPHPDDEVLVGSLPLRLLREAGAEVTNIVMTLGGDPARRAGRLAAVRESCRALGFSLELPAEKGRAFENLRVAGRALEPVRWQGMVARLAEVFADHAPDLVVFPHDRDGHPTHVAVHFLALAALFRYTAASGAGVVTAESEYWHPLEEPNLLVGVAGGDVARLLAALAAHGGELRRHPYHLRLPARLMDGVRRGAEVVCGFGAAAPAFAFAEIYRLGRLGDGFRQFARPGAADPWADIAGAVFAAPF